MLVVLSDLHLQDTINDAIKDEHGNILVDGIRNILPETFDQTFRELLSLAERRNAQELMIVLAGDIFDLNRSQQWFAADTNGIRPYGNHPPEKWGPVAEKIFNGISASNNSIFELLTKYSQTTLKNGQKVCFQYIPGNHDRLINMYPPLRKQVKELLGLAQDSALFPHEIALEKYSVHIRHGHEYDSLNFAGKAPPSGPFIVDSNAYNSAPFGDYATIDFASRLAFEYRRRYEALIVAGPDAEVHRFIYRTLLEFDDLRPQSAILAFLTSRIPYKEKMHEVLFPVIREVLLNAFNSSFVHSQIGSLEFTLGKTAKLIPFEILTNLWIQYQNIRFDPLCIAQREPVLREPVLNTPPYRFLVSGHTHNPEVLFLRRRPDNKELFFFDTGTWRRQIRRCFDNQTFASAKTLTYVAFYSPDENPGGNEVSFGYLSGYTKKELA